jgi:hypothetical protein
LFKTIDDIVTLKLVRGGKKVQTDEFFCHKNSDDGSVSLFLSRLFDFFNLKIRLVIGNCKKPEHKERNPDNGHGSQHKWYSRGNFWSEQILKAVDSFSWDWSFVVWVAKFPLNYAEEEAAEAKAAVDKA